MRILSTIVSSVGFVSALTLLFYDWKIALVVFLLSSLVYVIPQGPDRLLTILGGYFFIGAIISVFYDLRLAALFGVTGYLVTRFKLHAGRVNHEYYEGKHTENKSTTRETV